MRMKKIAFHLPCVADERDDDECWQILLGIGSNVDCERNLRAALDTLAERLFDLRISPVYESESVGSNGPNFFNLVLCANTDMSLSSLSIWLKAIECKQGRRAGSARGVIPLDIDVLDYGGLVGTFDGIALPRREILDYPFVLLPLAELVPDLVHPELKISYAELWQNGRSEMRLRGVEFEWRDVGQGKGRPIAAHTKAKDGAEALSK